MISPPSGQCYYYLHLPQLVLLASTYTVSPVYDSAFENDMDPATVGMYENKVA